VKTVRYFLCDHYRTERTVASNEAGPSTPQPAKRRRTVNKVSKRSACPAKLTVKELNNGTVEVDYEWVHLNHDPADWDEVAAEALDQGTKEWLKNQVDNEMNWTSISALLRLDDNEVDMLVSLKS
jgi:hypothetical protein